MAEKLVCDKGKKYQNDNLASWKNRPRLVRKRQTNKRPLFVKKQRKTDEVDVEVLDKQKGIGKA